MPEEIAKANIERGETSAIIARDLGGDRLRITTEQREEILRLLKRLQDQLGIAYLFITHDLGTVKRIANKVVVMLKGKIVAGGNTQTVFAPPYHPYTELLLSSVPEMKTDWLDGVLANRTKLRAAAAAAR